jgi:hypothetical protein
MGVDHLIFDASDFDSIDDTHSVGAFVRSGKSGALITHHAHSEAGSVSFDFVDGDVTVGTDAIAETAHGLETGDVVQLTTTGTLPTGLSTATDYYVIRVDANSFKLAASELDAERGDAVDITAAAGGGTHTLTEQERQIRALDVHIAKGINVEVDLDAGDDSVASWTHDGTGTAITSTAENGDQALDVHISNTEIAVVQGSDSPWSIDDGGGSITVDGSVTVSATDLDIRDLTHVTDSVSLGDGTTLYTGTTVGSDHGLDVYNLNDPSTANTAIATNANALGAANVAEDVVASPLANRKTLYIYNNSNKKVFIGETGVADTDGFPLSPGSYIELKAGSAIDIEWVAGVTGQEIRTLELS